MKTITKDEVGKQQIKAINKSYYNILQSDDEEDDKKEEDATKENNILEKLKGLEYVVK